ncbi:beta/gamma crystallin-related protein [Brevundimonas sp.]|uniref:beta/gamma crystallin-related protein n=1 Tax=Brevundimonas sp. TaxID=1871086 RepID=UPI002CFD0F5A|nr:beta/gamma crystallin-related protein [Brevundimonas sp.]HWQ88205.1 beta/gamma crystallin-related protein [Brevundimonas sp.]
MLIEMLAAMAVVSGGAGAAAQDPQVGVRVAPRGDYRDSCSGEYVNRGRLYADCRTDRGRIRGTSIELNRCSDYEIRNDDGLLVCGPWRGQFEDRPGGGGGNGPGWPGGGGGRTSAIIYRDADFRGATFRFDDGVPNLANTGFNDAISSLQLRGDWEVCTDAYYRGRCVILRDDVRNLRNSGLNDRISSLRPVRRGGL